MNERTNYRFIWSLYLTSIWKLPSCYRCVLAATTTKCICIQFGRRLIRYLIRFGELLRYLFRRRPLDKFLPLRTCVCFTSCAYDDELYLFGLPLNYWVGAPLPFLLYHYLCLVWAVVSTQVRVCGMTTQLAFTAYKPTHWTRSHSKLTTQYLHHVGHILTTSWNNKSSELISDCSWIQGDKANTDSHLLLFTSHLSFYLLWSQ